MTETTELESWAAELAALDQAMGDGPLALVGTSAPRAAALAGALPGPGGLVLRSPVADKREGLKVVGDVSWLGLAGLKGTLQLVPPSEGDGPAGRATLSVAPTEPAGWMLPALGRTDDGDYGLNFDSIEVALDSELALAEGAFNLTFSAGALQIPMQLLLPSSPQTWQVRSRGTLALPGVESLAALVPGVPLEALLPDALVGGLDLSIQSVGLTLNPSEGRLDGVSITVAASGTWSILGGAVKAVDPRLGLSLRRHGEGSLSRYISLSANVTLGGQEWTLRLRNVNGVHTWSAELFAPEGGGRIAALPFIGDEIRQSLPEGVADTAVIIHRLGLSVSFAKTDGGLRVADLDWSLPGAVQIPGLSALSLRNLSGTFRHMKQPEGPARNSMSLCGAARLGDTDLRVSMRLSAGDWAGSVRALPHASGQPGVSIANVLGALLPDADVPEGAGSVAFDEAAVSLTKAPAGWGCSIQLASHDTWTLELGDNGVELRGVALGFDKPAGGTATARISAGLEIDGTTIEFSAEVGGAMALQATATDVRVGSLFDRILGGAAWGSVPGIPAFIADLQLDTLSVVLDITGRAVQASSSNATFETIALWVSKSAAGWGFGAALSPRASFQLSTIAPELQPLDALTFNGLLLIVSSQDVPALQLDATSMGDTALDVRSGFNIAAKLQLDGTGVDKVLGSSELVVTAVVPTPPAGLVLTADVPGTTRLFESAELSETQLRLGLGAGRLEVALATRLALDFGPPRLQFQAAMEVQPGGATFDAQLVQPPSWKDAFGAKGLEVRGLGITLGLNFTGVPTLGMRGNVLLHSESGQFAFLFNSTNPAKSAITVSFVSLAFGSILHGLCDASLLGAMPAGVSAALQSSGLRDVELYVVPPPDAVEIAGATYQPGTRIKGALSLLGFDIAADIVIAHGMGIQASGSMSPVNLGQGALQLHGATADVGPSFAMRVGVHEPEQFVRFAGTLNLLGISRSAEVRLTDSGLEFTFAGTDFATTYSFTGELGADTFQVGGSVSFRLNLDLPAPSVPGSPTNLGRIQVDTSFTGSFKVGLSGGQLGVLMTGSFQWAGQTLSIPTLMISSPSAALLRDLPGEAIKHITANLDAIFSGVFSDADQWVQGVGDGFITGVDDSYDVVTSHFGKTADDAQRLLQDAQVGFTVHTDTKIHVNTPGVHVNTHGDTPGIDDNHLHINTPARHSNTTPHGNSNGSINTKVLIWHANRSSHFNQSHLGQHGNVSPPHNNHSNHANSSTAHSNTGHINTGHVNTPHVNSTPHINQPFGKHSNHANHVNASGGGATTEAPETSAGGPAPTPATPPIGWTQIPGRLRAISVGGGGEAWGINASSQIFKYGQDRTWEHVPGALECISVGPEGSVWGTNSAHEIYQHPNPGVPNQHWRRIDGALAQLSVGKGGEVWGVNGGGAVWRRPPGGTWQEFATHNVSGRIVAVAADPDGAVWAVGDNDWVWKHNDPSRADAGWRQVIGHLVQISAGSGGTIWGTNAGHESWGNDTAASWYRVTTPTPSTCLSIGPEGSLWSIARTGEIFLNPASPQVMFYDASTGTTAIHGLSPQGGEAGPRYAGRFTAGWTSVVPYLHEGETRCIFYNADTGAFVISELRPGQADRVLFSTSASLGWTSVTPFTQFGFSRCIFYNADTGRTVITDLVSAGQGIRQVWSGQFTPGWTAIVPYAHEGDSRCLFYNARSGGAVISEMNPGGAGDRPLWNGPLGPGLSHLVPYAQDGVTRCLTYNRSSGKARFQAFASGGQGLSPAPVHGFSQGWSDIQMYGDEGGPRCLFYNRSSGDTITYRIAADRLGDPLVRSANQAGASAVRVYVLL
ncbi:MAG: tectonin domain-containing protein [Myxococcota bacterium]